MQNSPTKIPEFKEEDTSNYRKKIINLLVLGSTFLGGIMKTMKK